MEVTETATEPEAEQSEADQMRDTEVGSVAATTRPAVYASFEATTTQEIHSRETEEEQPQMEVTEAAAEPEAEKSEADQMRDTDEGWGNWSRAQRKKWKEKEAKKQSKKK